MSDKLRQDFTQGLIDKGIDPERARVLAKEAHPDTEVLPKVDLEFSELPELPEVAPAPSGLPDVPEIAEPEGEDPAPILAPLQIPEVRESEVPPEVAKKDEPIGPVEAYQRRPTLVETKPVELPPVEGVAADHDIDMRGLLGALESGYRFARDSSDREKERNPSLSIDAIILEHARTQGISVDQMRKQARRQDIPFEYMVEQVSRGKATATESVDQSRERGELGFLGPEERKVAARGAANRRKAMERFQKTGDAEDLDQVWGAARVGLVKSDRDLPFMGVTTEEVVEGAKKGSESHDFALFLTEQLLKNQQVSQLVETYGTHEMGYRHYIDKRRDEYLAKKGFTPGTQEWEDGAPEATLRAYNELAALFTAGAWRGRIIMPANDLISTPEGADVSMKERSIFSPTLEVVGMAKRGGRIVTVVREQGALLHTFDILDMPQAAAVGMLDAGEISLEAAHTGVQQRRHALEFAMDSEFADQNMGTKAVSILGGGMALIFFPDLLSVGGKIGKVAKLAVDTGTTKKATLRASEILQDIYKAREEGNFAKASEAEAALRREFGQDGGVADALDIVDADVASRMADEFPDLLDPEFAASLPGTMGQRMMSLHASLRKQRMTKKLAEGQSLTFTNYKELFSTDLILADMQKMRRELVALGAQARVPAARRVIMKEMEGLRKLLGVADDADAARFMRRLEKSLHEIFEDSDAWSKRFHGKGNPDSELLKIDALRGPSQDMIDAATGDAKQALEALAKQLRTKRQKIHKLLGTIVTKTRDIKDPVPLLDRAIESVKTASETRAAAAEMLRHALLGTHKIIPNPVNPRPGEGELMPLSDYGARFADMIEEAFGLSREEAEVAARITDARARAWASVNGKEIGRWYDTRIAAVRSVEDMSAIPKTALKMAEEQGESPIFYSRLLAAAETLREGDIKIDSVVNDLRRAPKGIPKSELKWTGFELWLQERKAAGAKTVTKQDVIQFLESHAIRVDSQVTGEAVEAVTKARRAVTDYVTETGLISKMQATGLDSSQLHRLLVDPTQLRYFSRDRVRFSAKLAQIKLNEVIARHDSLSSVRQTLSKKIRFGHTELTAAEWLKDFELGTVVAAFPRVMDEIVTIFRQAHKEIRALDDDIAERLTPQVFNQTFEGLEDAVEELAALVEEDKLATALHHSDEWKGLVERAENLYEVEYLNPIAAAKYETYSVPGGEDYTEMTITLPAESRMPPFPTDARVIDRQSHTGQIFFPHNISSGLGDFGDVGEVNRYVAIDGAGTVLGSPADSPAAAKRNGRIGLAGFFPQSAGHEFLTAKQDIAVSARFKTRIGANGEKVLFIEEIQSDWSQRARQMAKEAGMPSGHKITTAPPKGIMKAMNTRLKDLQAEVLGLGPAPDMSAVNAKARQLSNDINSELDALGYSFHIGIAPTHAKPGVFPQVGDVHLNVYKRPVPDEMGQRRTMVDSLDMLGDIKGNPADYIITQLRNFHNEQAVGIRTGHFTPEQFPPTPFKDDWHKLMVKRIMRYAADNDFDSVAISRPEHITPLVTMEGFGGRPYITDRRWWDGEFRKLTPDEYDAELRAWQQRNPYASLEEAEDFERSLRQRPEPPDDDDLSVYNGIKRFYEGTLPNYMKKYLRQWGGKQREMVVDISDAGTYHRGIDADAEQARTYGSDWLTGRGPDSRPLSATKIEELREQRRAHSVIAFDITDDMRTGLKRPAPLMQVRGKNPVYYSKLTSVAENMPKRMAVDDLMGFLGRQPNPKAGQPMTYPRDVVSKETGEIRFKKGDKVLDKDGRQIMEPEHLYTKGVKEEEIKWTNVEEFLTEARAQGMTHVTRKDFLEHLEQNRVVVDSFKKGGPDPVRDALQANANDVFVKVNKLLDDSDVDWFPNIYHHVTADPSDFVRTTGEYAQVSSENLLETLGFEGRLAANLGRPGVFQATRGLVPELEAYADLLKLDTLPLPTTGIRAPQYIRDQEAAEYRRWQQLRHVKDPREWPAAPRLAMVEAIIPKLRVLVEEERINRPLVRRLEDGIQSLIDDPTWGIRKSTEEDDRALAVDYVMGGAGESSFLYRGEVYLIDPTDAQVRKWAETTDDVVWLRDKSLIPRQPLDGQRRLMRNHIRDRIEGIQHDRRKYNGELLLDQLESHGRILAEHIEAQRISRDPDFREYARLKEEINALGGNLTQFETYKLEGGTDYREVLIQAPPRTDGDRVFVGRHWKEKNVLVHYRTTTRFDDAGRRVLFVEEIQSDWHQQGRARGYSQAENDAIKGRLMDRMARIDDELDREPVATVEAELRTEYAGLRRKLRSANDGPVPDGPFKDTKTWTDLALKHIFRQAADEGYDGVAFTRSDLASDYVSMPTDAAQAYYDGTVLSRAKRHTKANPETIRMKGGRATTRYEHFEEVPYFALTEKAQARVQKPQVMFQRADTPTAAKPQTGWKFRELDDGSVELTSAEIRAARQAGEAPAAAIESVKSVENVGQAQVASNLFSLPGGRIKVWENSPGAGGAHSIVDFVVDESKRGQGVGSQLVDQVLQAYPDKEISAQVSSLASLKVLHNKGFRHPGAERLDFDSLAKLWKDEGGSLNLRRAPEAPAEVMGGGLTFKMDGNTLRIKTSELPEALQGRGMGSELYLRALRHAKDKGFRVASDVNPSPEAMSVYNKLQEAGVPIRRELSEVDGQEVLEFIIEADQLKNVNFDTVAETLMKQRLDKTEMGLYSGLRLAATKLPDKVQTDAVLTLLRKQGGVKADELKWVGVPGWLESMKAAGRKSLTRQEIVQFMDQNAVNLTVTRLSRQTAVEIPPHLRKALDDAENAADAAWAKLEPKARATGLGESALHEMKGNPGRARNTLIRLTNQHIDEFRVGVNDGTIGVAAGKLNTPEKKSVAEDLGNLAAMLSSTIRFTETQDALALTEDLLRRTDLLANIGWQSVNYQLRTLKKELRRNLLVRGTAHLDYQNARSARDAASRAVSEATQRERPRWKAETIDGRTRTKDDPPYEEILIKHPFVADTTGWKTQQMPDGTWQVTDGGSVLPSQMIQAINKDLVSGTTADEAIATAKNYVETHPGAERLRDAFRHYHWSGHENVLAHARMSTRYDVNGNKVLFVEEIQSDWHQAGRAGGYIRSDADKKKIEDLVLQLQKQITPQSSLEDVQAAADQLNKLFYKVGGARSTRVAAVNADPLMTGNVGPTLVVQGYNPNIKRWSTTRPPEDFAHKDLSSGLALTIMAGRGGPRGKVRAGPFSKNWAELAIKQVLRKAADEGYHSVAFNKGDVVQDVVDGKGSGQRYFYDEMVPKILRDYAQKQWGVPTQRIQMDWADEIELDRLTQQRRGVEAVGGTDPEVAEAAEDTVRRYRELNADGGVVGIRISDEMRGSINAGQTMFQGEEGVIKGAVEFLDDGRATIFALKQGDISTVVHELGHIFRRDLDVTDLRVVEKWADVVDGQWTVEAEEKFARAFERYLREGDAPNVGLRTVFEKLKVWLSEIYRNVVGTPIDVELTDEVRQVFKNLLSEQPPNRPPLQRIERFIDKELFGPPGEEGIHALQQLAQEALRVGATDSTAVDMLGPMMASLARNDSIVFRKPVLGKTTWTKEDLAKLQTTMESEAIAARRAKQPSIPLRSMSEAVAEETPDQKLRSAFNVALDKKYRDPSDYATAGIAAVARASIATVLGGDEFAALRQLPPAVRQSVLAGTRTVEQAYGDMIRLVGEGDIDAAAKFLGGETVKFKNGRDALSSGFDATGAVMQDMNRWITQVMPEKHRDALIRLARNINEAPEGRSGVGVELSADRDTAEALEWFFGNSRGAEGSPRLLKQLRESIEVETAIRPSHEMRLVEVFLHHAGVTERAGELSDARGAAMAHELIDDISEIYGKEDSLRMAVLFAGYGQSVKARQKWAGLGMAISKADFDAYHSWLNGMAVPKEMQPKMRAIAARFGMNPNFMRDAVLDVDMYLPAAARNRMGEALARGSQQVQVSGKFGEQFYEDKMRGTWRGLYQYMKTRMTRGGFFVRQRYFLMNTIDHFTQMAITSGFRTAFVSSIRMASQNFMVLPGVAHTARLAESLGVEKASERMRQLLQSGGDRMANAVGEMMGMSKYRIEVNPILEGLDGTFTVTDAAGRSKVYRYREIRDIAVEEGIFASFDTRALERSIKRAVDLQSDDLIEVATNGRMEQAAGSVKRVTRELTDIVSETAEAWSERERLGAMVTLMEAGMSPRDAARMTIDALYDYAGSMSKVDRHVLVNLAFPFWAFQKNANRQILNAMFSPAGAYRMGVMRRAQEGATYALTELFYDRVADPYGIDWESMPQELQDNYWALRQSVEYGYGPLEALSAAPGGEELLMDLLHAAGVKSIKELDPKHKQFLENGFGGPSRVPPDVRNAMRAYFGGIQHGLTDEFGDKRVPGATVTIDQALANYMYRMMPTSESQGRIESISSYYNPKPSASGRRSYLRDRHGLAITPRMTEDVRRFQALMPRDHVYIEMYLPDSTINAGFRHAASSLALQYMAARGVIKAGREDYRVTMQGIQTNLEAIGDPFGAPVPAAMSEALTGEGARPRRLHPFFGTFLPDHVPFLSIASIPAQQDPWDTDDEDEVERRLEEIQRLATDVEVPIEDVGVYEQRRHYVSPGVVSLAFSTSPFGELNDQMLMWEKTPVEEAVKEAWMLNWARGVLGVQTGVVSRRKTARSEIPKFIRTSPTPPRPEGG